MDRSVPPTRKRRKKGSVKVRLTSKKYQYQAPKTIDSKLAPIQTPTVCNKHTAFLDVVHDLQHMLREVIYSQEVHQSCYLCQGKSSALCLMTSIDAFLKSFERGQQPYDTPPSSCSNTPKSGDDTQEFHFLQTPLDSPSQELLTDVIPVIQDDVHSAAMLLLSMANGCDEDANKHQTSNIVDADVNDSCDTGTTLQVCHPPVTNLPQVHTVKLRLKEEEIDGDNLMGNEGVMCVLHPEPNLTKMNTEEFLKEIEPEPAPELEPKPTSDIVDTPPLNNLYNFDIQRGGGFLNFGNSCFVASTMQVLLHMKPIVKLLKHEKTHHFGNCLLVDSTITHSDADLSVNAADFSSSNIVKKPLKSCLFCTMNVICASHQELNVVDISSLKKHIHSWCPSLINGRQQDAHEFLGVVLNCIGDKFVNEHFGFKVSQQKICKSCNLETEADPVVFTQLQVEVHKTIQESVKNFSDFEEVESYCSNCKIGRLQIKKFNILTHPEAFIVHIQRFKNSTRKNIRNVHVGTHIEIGSSKYALCGMVMHHGTSVNSGHYTAAVRWHQESSGKDMWSFFNDQEIKDFSCLDEIRSKGSAYILVYEKTVSHYVGISKHASITDFDATVTSCPISHIVGIDKRASDTDVGATVTSYPISDSKQTHSKCKSYKGNCCTPKPSKPFRSPLKLHPLKNTDFKKHGSFEKNSSSPQLRSVLRTPYKVHKIRSPLRSSFSSPRKSPVIQSRLSSIVHPSPSVKQSSFDTPTTLSPSRGMMLTKKGSPVTSEIQKAVRNVFIYFEKEKYHGKPLCSLQKVGKRTSDALLVSSKLVSKVMGKVKRNSPFKTPKRTRPNRKKKLRNVDKLTADALRNLIYEKVRLGEPFTVSDLVHAVRGRGIDFHGQRDTLRKVLHDLGFKYKGVDGRRFLMQKPSVRAKRISFLKKYVALKDKFPIVWLDETWIFRKGAMKHKTWQDEDVRSCATKTIDVGKRYIVVNAGGDKGWVEGASLVFPSKTKGLDYHDEMNSENFMKYWREQILDNLHEPTLIIMDGASYHSVQADHQPTSASTVNEMKKWLDENNIPFDDSLNKKALYEIVKLHRKPPRYLADEEAHARGHIVLRLPPYHCIYNPIEIAWSITKDYYNKHIRGALEQLAVHRNSKNYSEIIDEAVIDMWRDSMKRVTADTWSKIIAHFDKTFIMPAWEQEVGCTTVDVTDYATMKFQVEECTSDSDDSYDDSDVDDPGTPTITEVVITKTVPKVEVTTAKRSLDFELPSLDNDYSSAVIDLEKLDQQFCNEVTNDELPVSDRIVSINGSHTIRGRDLSTLVGLQDLNDQVVNFYMSLIMKRSTCTGKKVFAFSTFFCPKLKESTYSGVQRHTKKVNIFDVQYIVFPLHLDNHWAVIIANNTEQKLMYFDSLGGVGHRYLQIIWNYMIKEAEFKKAEHFHSSSWQKIVMKDIPRQSNSHDCGAFVCWYVECVTQGLPVLPNEVDSQTMRQNIDLHIRRVSICNHASHERCSISVSEESEKVKAPPKKRKAEATLKLLNKAVVKRFKKVLPRNITTSVEGALLLGSGHLHLRSPQLLAGNNCQSSVVATCAIAAYVSKPVLTNEDISVVVVDGHNQFLQLSQLGFEAKSIPLQVTVFRESFAVDSTSVAIECSSDTQRCIKLSEAVVNSSSSVPDGVKYGFVLVSDNRCLSFWSHTDGQFLLFNGHCVTINNSMCVNVRSGASRLFKCRSVEALAVLSFNGEVFDRHKWELFLLKFNQL